MTDIQVLMILTIILIALIVPMLSGCCTPAVRSAGSIREVEDVSNLDINR